LQTILVKLLPQPIKRKGILIESLIFIVIYIFVLTVLPADSSGRILVENLAILTASATAAFLIFFSVPGMPISSRRAWLILGAAQVAWLAGAFLMDYVQSLIGGLNLIINTANTINFIACLLSGYALFLFPFRSRHAPTRFRFILDAIISSGVVVTLGFLLFVRPLSDLVTIPLGSLINIFYPIADCILLILLANFSLANWVPRQTGKFLGAAWVAFLISDYIHVSLVLIGNYHPGSLVSLGWVCGSLLIGLGAVFEKENRTETESSTKPSTGFDVWAQFQKVLPIALVLVLIWYVITDRQLRGSFSPFGLWMSALLGVMLIVRLGIRAGEAELNQYWQLFKNLGDPSFICDPTGRILLGNPASEAISVSKEQGKLIGQSLFEIFDGLYPSDIEQSIKWDQTLNASLKKDGTPYLLSLSPIITENSKALIAGVAHDLSEQKRQRDVIQHAYDELQAVYKKLEDLNAQLEQKVEERTGTLQEAYRQLEEQNKVLQGLDQIKTDFVSLVSHELRAPLTNLGGGLELLLSKEHEAGDQKNLLLIQSEIQRLTRFVENILNVSAMEAGRFVLRPIKLSLPLIVNEVRDGWRNLPDVNRIQAEVNEDLPLVLADEGAVRSVLSHLIDNALKYAPKSNVRICAELEDEKIRVEVRDFGPGIPSDKQNLLFERFQRLEAKDSQSIYGYGLGLYLSQRLLKAMNSELHFEPPLDGGARFYFYLGTAE
jgi:signal transduction histidine kinase